MLDLVRKEVGWPRRKGNWQMSRRPKGQLVRKFNLKNEYFNLLLQSGLFTESAIVEFSFFLSTSDSSISFSKFVFFCKSVSCFSNKYSNSCCVSVSSCCTCSKLDLNSWRWMAWISISKYNFPYIGMKNRTSDIFIIFQMKQPCCLFWDTSLWSVLP